MKEIFMNFGTGKNFYVLALKTIKMLFRLIKSVFHCDVNSITNVKIIFGNIKVPNPVLNSNYEPVGHNSINVRTNTTEIIREILPKMSV
jgi:hypothetical protein